MGQNMGVPSFNSNQMGDTFYFTPLTAFVFGVVDTSIPDGDELMNSYIWHEKDGKRGANNIDSLLYKDYEARGFFEQKNQG
eukprot:9848438-Ditylum_brightwellii.AAC.1